MNNRIEELEMRMDRCKHGRPVDLCSFCYQAEFERRHNKLIAGAIGFALFSFLFFLFAVSCGGAEINDRFLDALALVESGNNPLAVGRRGELGAYQFRRAAWLQVSMEPYAWAAREHAARRSARKYCEWIEAHLTLALGRRPSAAGVYAAYNCGLSRFASRGYRLARCPKSTRDAAKRLQAML